MPHLFCFGCGYCARALAATLAGSDWRVTGTCRTADEARALEALGIEPLVFDGERPGDGVRDRLAAATHLLVSIPPDAEGDPALRHHGIDIAAATALEWVGYLSATSVYGDRRGGLVTEATPPAPTTDRGRRRLAAERQWLALGAGHGLPVHLFRLAGIYGPGRNALRQIEAGTARRIRKPGQVFGRVHVADVAAVLRASMARPDPGAVYNVADDEPAPPEDVVVHAARLLGREPPPPMTVEEAGLSPKAASFYTESKRVANDRIKGELGVTLAFPSYRDGLADLVRSGHF